MWWLWIIVGFVIGFTIASGVWYYAAVKKDDPVGYLIEDRAEGVDMPAYFIKFPNEESVRKLETQNYAKFCVIHSRYKKGRKNGEQKN